MVLAAVKRLSIFLPSVHGGGAERAMLVFGEELIKRGYSVDLVVASFKGPYVNRIPKGIAVVDLNSRRMLKAIPRLARYLKETKPDAVFSTITHANIAAIWAAKSVSFKSPVIVRQSNAPRAETKSSLGRYIASRIIPYAYRYASGIIAVSAGVRDELIQLNNSLDELIRVIPTPVLSQEVRKLGEEALDHEWFKWGQPPVVLSAGRLEPHKGMLELIRAFAQVHKRCPARLVILGQGSQRERLEREIRKLKLESVVELVGFKANPFSYMSRAATFVLASYYEGLPNVLVQALAFGLPVVATNCKSGPAEILEDGRLGKLVPVGDTDKLANAIVESLKLPKQTHAQDLVWQRYSADDATSRYLGMVEIETKQYTKE